MSADERCVLGPTGTSSSARLNTFEVCDNSYHSLPVA